MTRNIVLNITLEDNDDDLVTLLTGISYIQDNLPIAAVEVFEPKSEGSTKLADNKKFTDRIKADIISTMLIETAGGEDNDEFSYETFDTDQALKNISNTLKEYDKYYDQKRIV